MGSLTTDRQPCKIKSLLGFVLYILQGAFDFSPVISYIYPAKQVGLKTVYDAIIKWVIWRWKKNCKLIERGFVFLGQPLIK